MAGSLDRDGILQTALARFKTIASAESENRAQALEDMKFVYNIDEGQWPASIRAERLKDQRPCLSTNKLRKFVAVVANQATQNRPAIGVRPVDDLADPATAKMHEDIIRNVEYQSSADRIYAMAIEHAIAGSIGYWRILTRYLPGTFEQEAYLEALPNPFAVYLDPKKRYGFIRTTLTKEEFRLRYPKATVGDFTEVALGDASAYWFDSERVIVAEYFWKEPVTQTLAQIHDPATNATRVVPLSEGATKAKIEAQGLHVIAEREETTWRVKWAVLTGAEVLDVRDWPDDEIPIFEVCGDTHELEGRTIRRSLIRDGKDPMRMYNYWVTSMTETIGLAPKAPYLLTPEQIQGYEAMWQEANVKNLSYLLYHRAGLEKPSRERPPEIPSAAMAMLKIADQDIKDTIGIFEPGLGDVSNERSGVAIRNRQARSDLGTAHFYEALRQAIIETGRALIRIHAKILDTERVVRMRGVDGTDTFTRINQRMYNPASGQVETLNDLSVGTYDVEATVRTYQSRREEAVEQMIQAMQYAPMAAPLILPLVFKHADWPGADEIAEALRPLSQQMAAGQTAPSSAPRGAPPSIDGVMPPVA